MLLPSAMTCFTLTLALTSRNPNCSDFPTSSGGDGAADRQVERGVLAESEGPALDASGAGSDQPSRTTRFRRFSPVSPVVFESTIARRLTSLFPRAYGMAS